MSLPRLQGNTALVTNGASGLGKAIAQRLASDGATVVMTDIQRELGEAMFAVNVEGTFLGCRAAIAAMRRTGGGSIINMSSMGSLVATASSTAYGASKAVVRKLTKSVAQYCAQQKLNIRCNSVHPGMVLTPMWQAYVEETARIRGVPAEQVIEEAWSQIPLGDFTRAEDIATAVSFLASEGAPHVTSSKLLVDGGIIHCRT